jgi:hypothetical protein
MFARIAKLSTSSIAGIRLSASGLIALADIKTIANRTALTGSASFLDILLIAPGIHCQQASSEVNKGEYPTTGALTTGYVFRIENQATVGFLLGVGKTGHLVNIVVSPSRKRNSRYSVFASGVIPTIFYLCGIALTIAVTTLLAIVRDWWALGTIGMLMLARLLNVVVIKRRSQMGWKGAPEPGVHGDLLVLLSQDRWVRMRGLVDDLKAVTSGQWLRDETSVDGFAASFATLLVFVSAAVASNASTIGGLLLGCLLLSSAALLGLCNSQTKNLQMFGRTLKQEGPPKAYHRRLDLAVELIAESGRDDWAIAMGMVVSPEVNVQKVTP